MVALTIKWQDTLGVDITIISTSGGHLLCQHHNKNWCNHIMQAMVDDLDVEDLWANINQENSIGYDVVTLMIPYCPQLNVWAKVDIRDEAGKGRMVYLIKPDDSSPERIGIIFPGEGRNIIRQMLHNWFVVKQFHLTGPQAGTPVPVRCRASSHAPVQQNELITHMREESTEWGERWLIYYTGMCHACVVIQSDIADLVPGPN